jgi:hypothetical protein
VDPSTDVAMNYWMPFGSAAQIATTSTPGLVMPDGTTITITNTGLIKAVLGIGDITGVTIASPTNGQVLKYNSTTQKWENSSLGTAANKDATSVITSGSTDLIEAGAVYSANQTLTTQIATKADSSTVTALANDVDDISDEIADMNNVLGAKNLLPNNAASQTLDGITYTINSDGSITVSGTASGNTGIVLADSFHLSPNTDYILSGCPSNGATNTYSMFIVDTNDSSFVYYDVGNGITFNSGNHTRFKVIINIIKNVTISNLVFKPMIRPASIADNTYVPYAMTNKELTDLVPKAYNIPSLNVTSIPPSTETRIYSGVLPKGIYVISAQLFMSGLKGWMTHIWGGGFNSSARNQMAIATDERVYDTVTGVIESDGVTPIHIGVYHEVTGQTITRTYNYDKVTVVKVG